MRARVAFAMLAVAGIAASASAQSITTLFESNNGGSAGGAVYFDITVGAMPLLITGLDTNVAGTSGFGWTVYTAPNTSVGFEADPTAWTQVATGIGMGMGTDVPSPVSLDNTFLLDAGTSYGIAFVVGAETNHRYSGTGASPAPGELQYSNADLTLDLGSATNVPFSGAPFRPRIWNGTLYYEVIPAPASLALLGLGGLAAARRRR